MIYFESFYMNPVTEEEGKWYRVIPTKAGSSSCRIGINTSYTVAAIFRQ